MFAQRADDIVGERVAFVYPAANFADKAFFAFGLRFGFDVGLIIRIGHRFDLAKGASFGDFADEHAMRVEIDILYNLE